MPIPRAKSASRQPAGSLNREAPPEWRSSWYLLCLEPGAPKAEIEKNFRRLSLLLHPDQHMSEGPAKIEEYTYEFSLINTARTKLLNRTDRDWGKVQVKAGWKRLPSVEEWAKRTKPPGEQKKTINLSKKGIFHPQNNFSASNIFGPGSNVSRGGGIFGGGGNFGNGGFPVGGTFGGGEMFGGAKNPNNPNVTPRTGLGQTRSGLFFRSTAGGPPAGTAGFTTAAGNPTMFANAAGGKGPEGQFGGSQFASSANATSTSSGQSNTSTVQFGNGTSQFGGANNTFRTTNTSQFGINGTTNGTQFGNNNCSSQFGNNSSNQFGNNQFGKSQFDKKLESASESEFGKNGDRKRKTAAELRKETRKEQAAAKAAQSTGFMTASEAYDLMQKRKAGNSVGNLSAGNQANEVSLGGVSQMQQGGSSSSSSSTSSSSNNPATAVGSKNTTTKTSDKTTTNTNGKVASNVNSKSANATASSKAGSSKSATASGNSKATANKTTKKDTSKSKGPQKDNKKKSKTTESSPVGATNGGNMGTTSSGNPEGSPVPTTSSGNLYPTPTVEKRSTNKSSLLGQRLNAYDLQAPMEKKFLREEVGRSRSLQRETSKSNVNSVKNHNLNGMDGNQESRSGNSGSTTGGLNLSFNNGGLNSSFNSGNGSIFTNNGGATLKNPPSTNNSNPFSRSTSNRDSGSNLTEGASIFGNTTGQNKNPFRHNGFKTAFFEPSTTANNSNDPSSSSNASSSDELQQSNGQQGHQESQGIIGNVKAAFSKLFGSVQAPKTTDEKKIGTDVRAGKWLFGNSPSRRKIPSPTSTSVSTAVVANLDVSMHNGNGTPKLNTSRHSNANARDDINLNESNLSASSGHRKKNSTAGTATLQNPRGLQNDDLRRKRMPKQDYGIPGTSNSFGSSNTDLVSDMDAGNRDRESRRDVTDDSRDVSMRPASNENLRGSSSNDRRDNTGDGSFVVSGSEVSAGVFDEIPNDLGMKSLKRRRTEGGRAGGGSSSGGVDSLHNGNDSNGHHGMRQSHSMGGALSPRMMQGNLTSNLSQQLESQGPANNPADGSNLADKIRSMQVPSQGFPPGNPQAFHPSNTFPNSRPRNSFPSSSGIHMRLPSLNSTSNSGGASASSLSKAAGPSPINVSNNTLSSNPFLFRAANSSFLSQSIVSPRSGIARPPYITASSFDSTMVHKRNLGRSHSNSSRQGNNDSQSILRQEVDSLRSEPIPAEKQNRESQNTLSGSKNVGSVQSRDGNLNPPTVPISSPLTNRTNPPNLSPEVIDLVSQTSSAIERSAAAAASQADNPSTGAAPDANVPNNVPIVSTPSPSSGIPNPHIAPGPLGSPFSDATCMNPRISSSAGSWQQPQHRNASISNAPEPSFLTTGNVSNGAHAPNPQAPAGDSSPIEFVQGGHSLNQDEVIDLSSQNSGVTPVSGSPNPEFSPVIHRDNMDSLNSLLRSNPRDGNFALGENSAENGNRRRISDSSFELNRRSPLDWSRGRKTSNPTPSPEVVPQAMDLGSAPRVGNRMSLVPPSDLNSVSNMFVCGMQRSSNNNAHPNLNFAPQLNGMPGENMQSSNGMMQQVNMICNDSLMQTSNAMQNTSQMMQDNMPPSNVQFNPNVGSVPSSSNIQFNPSVAHPASMQQNHMHNNVVNAAQHPKNHQASMDFNPVPRFNQASFASISKLPSENSFPSNGNSGISMPAANSLPSSNSRSSFPSAFPTMGSLLDEIDEQAQQEDHQMQDMEDISLNFGSIGFGASKSSSSRGGNVATNSNSGDQNGVRKPPANPTAPELQSLNFENVPSNIPSDGQPSGSADSSNQSSRSTGFESGTIKPLPVSLRPSSVMEIFGLKHEADAIQLKEVIVCLRKRKNHPNGTGDVMLSEITRDRDKEMLLQIFRKFPAYFQLQEDGLRHPRVALV